MVPRNNNELVDLGYLRTISEDPEFLREMIRRFLEHAPVYLSEMKAACDQKSWEKLSLSTHKLKPSATYMGINGLLQVLLNIEKHCNKNPDPNALTSLIRQADALCEKAYPLLEKELG